jgi:hypothetical protein
MTEASPAAFYVPLGDGRFRATAHTVGPWDPGQQHAGPPSALLARAVERCGDGAGTLVHRVALDVLGPVPVDEVTVTARVVRPGRRVQLVEAELTAGGRTAMRAAAWRVDATPTGAAPVTHADLLPGPGPLPEARDFPAGWVRGYLDAVEWRPVSGGFTEPGPTTVWARPRLPLVDGEDHTPLTRLLTVADSGNGASAVLDPREWLFVNTDLTVHLHREPAGEWVGLDAATSLDGYGAGTAATVLHDTAGPVGRAAQALVVTPRHG